MGKLEFACNLITPRPRHFLQFNHYIQATRRGQDIQSSIQAILRSSKRLLRNLHQRLQLQVGQASGGPGQLPPPHPAVTRSRCSGGERSLHPEPRAIADVRDQTVYNYACVCTHIAAQGPIHLPVRSVLVFFLSFTFHFCIHTHNGERSSKGP